MKVLNVQGEPIEIVERAAALYGEDAHGKQPVYGGISRSV